MNYRLFVLSIVIFISTYSLYSSEPLVRFYLQDGSIKSYNLSEIENIQLPNSPDTLQLQVFTNDGNTFYYPAQLIDTIAFSIGQYGNQYINLWHDAFKWDFAVYKIDSILLYYTKHVAVTIGTQHWMYRNLNVDHFRNGDSIPEVRDSLRWTNLTTGAWCYFNYDPALGTIYRKLYNWYAINDSRSLAPTGWHVPSDLEWTKFTDYLGGLSIAGNKLKESGTSNWISPNTGATNETGFSALPGGYNSIYGTFRSIGIYGSWWSTTENNTTTAWDRGLVFSSANVFRYDNFKGSGFSVRCIKD